MPTVVEVLQCGTATVSELAEELGIAARTVRQQITTARKVGPRPAILIKGWQGLSPVYGLRQFRAEADVPRTAPLPAAIKQAAYRNRKRHEEIQVPEAA